MGNHLSFRMTARQGTTVMAAILIVTVALVGGTLYWSRQELSQVETSVQVSTAYGQTAMSAALASIHSTNFAQTQNEEDLLAFQAAILATFQYESLIKELGSDDDRAYLQDLEAQYAADIVSATQTLQDIATGVFEPDDGQSLASGTLTDLTESLNQRAQLKREQAIENLESYQSTQELLSLVGIVTLLLGMPIVVGSYILTRRYEHQEIVHEVELARLQEVALTDGLTGLSNHRAFQEDLRREVSRAARNGQPITIAMMDVDDFKEINDSEGHAKGDQVLAELAGLMSYVRSQDRAYRVGGDEFALIMPETGPDEAGTALERLRVAVEDGLPGTSMSIGYASTRDAVSPEILRDHADLALYEAKHKGKNQVMTFDPSLTEGMEITQAKTQAIRRVLERGEVTIWYQPIYHYGGRHLLAFEALLRLLEEPDIEGPQEAFHIAEGLGKARDLDLLCVAQALESATGLPEGVKLFINLDPATLTNSRFSVQDLTELVDASVLDRSRIVFEVTEQTIVPVAILQEQVEAIRAAGFGAALDDVGTGNAGLELMRVIKFDYVKIDRSVIVDASTGGQGRAVLLAVVAFARETGSFMIAEGIEDAGTLAGITLDEPGLREFWVRGVQGFLMGEPRASMSSFTSEADEPTRAA